MHAVEAINRGFDVEHFEAAPEPRESTPRSFGGLNFSWACGGLDLRLSVQSAAMWRQLADSVDDGILRPTGSLTVSTEDNQRSVLESLMQRPDADERGWTILDPGDQILVSAGVNGDFSGALHSSLDAVLEPRSALSHIHDHLSTKPGYRLFAGKAVRDFGSDSVTDSAGRVHRGDIVVLCPGSHSELVSSTTSAPNSLRPVRLQVTQTQPMSPGLTIPLADMSGMLRQGLVADGEVPNPLAMPSADPVELRLKVVPRISGALAVGEARHRDEPFDFDLPERPIRTLTERLERILGVTIPPVSRHWTGDVRECVDGRLWYREDLDDSVVLVTGAGQRGITLSPMIAKDTFDWLVEGSETGGARPDATGA